jgi:hypothetical protein
VAVCGPSAPRDQDLLVARKVGGLLAERGATLICGGLGGAMAAAAAGARERGGTVVGILPGNEPAEAGPDVELAIATGLGEMRNCLIARSAEAVIAIGGGVGTLSEIAFALVLGKPVVRHRHLATTAAGGRRTRKQWGSRRPIGPGGGGLGSRPGPTRRNLRGSRMSRLRPPGVLHERGRRR